MGELERKLEEVGHGVGLRLLEILAYRERAGRRDTRLLDVLRFIHSTLWKYLFGRQAKDLEQSNTVRGKHKKIMETNPPAKLKLIILVHSYVNFCVFFFCRLMMSI